MRSLMLALPLALAMPAFAEEPAAPAAEASYSAPVVRTVKPAGAEEFELTGDLPADLKGGWTYQGTGEFADGKLVLTLASMSQSKTAAKGKEVELAKIAVPAMKGHKGGYMIEVKDKAGAVIFTGCTKGKGVSCKILGAQLAGANKLVIERANPPGRKAMMGFYFKDLMQSWNIGQALVPNAPACTAKYTLSMQVDDRDLGRIIVCEGEPGPNQPAVYAAPAKDGKEGARYAISIPDGKKHTELLEGRLK